MATRRDAREWALQMLFELDLNPSDDLPGLFERFWRDKAPADRGRRYAERLVAGVQAERARLDERIQRAADNWEIHRMSVVDRNVLRMALYEMLYEGDVPPAVTINEAVDIAKYFSSADSGKFVNGILDRVRKEQRLAPREPPSEHRRAP